MVRSLILLFICTLPGFALADSLLPEKELNFKKLGINAFLNDPQFGSIDDQLHELRSTLHLRQIRVLFNWNNQVQPTANSAIDFSFYDEIISSLPKKMRVLVILNGLPSWMSTSANWIDANPRKTFIERWVKPVVTRYRKRKKIIAWQVWNEPNATSDEENVILEVDSSPENYLEMLSLASDTIRDITPKKLVVSAATTAIGQNWPETLDYNQALKDAGAESVLDIWGVHYYGTHLETLLLGGVADFMNSLSKPIWITESGERGVNNQLSYAKQIWPFLLEQVPGIKRIYQYQFTEDSAANNTYGLKNPDQSAPVSDLYIYIRDRH